MRHGVHARGNRNVTSSEKAAFLRKEGCNCAQSVLASLSACTGLDDETAKAAGACLGGGAGAGELCGAVSGAAAAIGLGVFRNEGEVPEHDRGKALGTELCRRFREEFGALRCEDLLTMTFPERRCSEYIERARAIAEELIIAERSQ